MSLVATSLATTIFLRPAITEAFKHISPYLVQKCKGTYLTFNLEKAISNLETRFETILKVRTIYENRKAVHISEFYYPTKVYIGDDLQTINNISEFKVANNIIVEGTIGHGKSMFMRHLTLNEVLDGKRIPIFFELRRLGKAESLQTALCSNLSDLFDVEIKEADFFHLARNGFLTLFLDGFDEISSSETVNSVIRNLESWATRFPHMRIVCSSRPDSSIQNSVYFFPVKISNYDDKDQQNFLNHLVKDHDITKQLMEKISNSSIDMQDLLRTPLMLTLFLRTYEIKLKTPMSLSDFYSDLFDVLMNRHDALKAPFTRGRFIDVEDSVLQDIFEEFCLYTKENGNKLTFSLAYFKKGLEKSLENLGISIEPNNLVKEFTKNICLILQDGNDYSFIHKSVQEFFVSNLIKSFDISYLETFYNDMRCIENSREYVVELAFLRELDKLNHTKHYVVPSLNHFSEFYDDKKEGKLHFLDHLFVAFSKQNPDKPIFLIKFPYEFHRNCAYIHRKYLSPFILQILFSKDMPAFERIITCDISDEKNDSIKELEINTKDTRFLRQYVQVNSMNMHLLESVKQELDEARAYIATKSRLPYKVKR